MAYNKVMPFNSLIMLIFALSYLRMQLVIFLFSNESCLSSSSLTLLPEIGGEKQ